MSSTNITDTDTAPGTGRHYFRDVIVRRCDDGALALRVYGHVACALDTSVQETLDDLTDRINPGVLQDGDVVATLRLIPRRRHVQVVHEIERGGA